MARAKKGDAKVDNVASGAAVATSSGATLSIDVDSFVRTRDSVVTGLATLQDAIQTLSSAYIKHTNAVLGEHGAGLDIDSALSRLGENPLLGGLGNLRGATPVQPVVEGKKEKKKRTHDPNAPKRPLTPYFLYMQTARPIIAIDLGPDVAKGAVSTEGVRRWNAMAPGDKQLWTNAYTDNLRLYNARMHSYKAGNASAKDMTDEEALAYAEMNTINVHEPTADGQLVAEALLDAPADDDDEVLPPREPTPPLKTPKGKPSRKAKGKDAPTPVPAAPAVSGPIVPPGSAKPAAAPSDASPNNKRKRPGKKGKDADEPVASIEKEDEQPKGPKSKKKKA